MSGLSWPSLLPPANADGYVESYQSLRFTQENDRFPFSADLRDQRLTGTLDVSWTFTHDQMDAFVFFYDQTLYFGARTFMMPIYEVNNFVARLVRFLAPYSASRQNDGWQVTARLAIFKFENLIGQQITAPDLLLVGPSGDFLAIDDSGDLLIVED